MRSKTAGRITGCISGSYKSDICSNFMQALTTVPSKKKTCSAFFKCAVIFSKLPHHPTVNLNPV